MDEPTLNSAIPSAVVHKLNLVRQRKKLVHVASAIMAALAVLLTAMSVAMLIDWLATLYDSRWRLALTLSAIGAAAVTTIGWLGLVWRGRLSWARVAGDIDRRFPILEQRWTTVTELRPEDATNPELVHPAMLRRVATESERLESQVEPRQVVSLSPLIRTLLAVTAISAILITAVVLDAAQTLVLIGRFWLPSASISLTELVNVPGNVVVGRGEALVLEADLNGRLVDRAKILLRDDRDTTRTIALFARGEQPIGFSHRVRSVDSPFDYRFQAGDGQTEWHSVSVADRPEIDKLQLRVTPPAYARRDARSFDSLPRKVSALERSELELALRPVNLVTRVELRIGQDKTVPLLPGTDGWYRWNTTLEDSFEFAPILTESHGLQNRQIPRCEVAVYADKPPVVKVVSPDDQIEVRPDDTVQIAFTAEDDIGIGAAELLIYDDGAGEAAPIAAIPVPLDEQAGSRTVQRTVDLDLEQLGFQDGSEFSYEVRVREDRGRPQEEQLTTTLAPTERASVNPTSAVRPPEEASLPDSATSVNESQTAVRSSERNESADEQQASQSASSTDQAMSNTRPANGKDSAAAPQLSQPPAIAPTNVGSGESAAAQPSTEARESAQIRSAQEKVAGEVSVAESKSDAAPADNKLAPDSDPQHDMATDAEHAKPAGGDAKPQKTNSSSSVAPPGNSRSSEMPDKQEGGPGQTASSGRKSLSANEAKERREQTESIAKSSNPPSASSPSSDRDNNTQTSAASQTASNAQPGAQSTNGGNRPNDSMTRRNLDIVPQESSSQRMRLKVDEFAGSFAGQQRAKVELSIGPELDALDQVLSKAERTARAVLDELRASEGWQGRHDRDVTNAESLTADGAKIIARLQQKSKDTPYAFIGLQVSDIGLAHVTPARSEFWKALQSNGDDRQQSVRDAAQHLARAREMVAELKGQFARAKNEFQLAESVERVKKMYQVYIENSLALLQVEADDPIRYNRKIAEFELDDEYLARLREVLEMRRDMQAELARILAEDPRLLRRFMDALKNRTNNLREELAKLVAGQDDLSREVRAWSVVEEAQRPKIAKILLQRKVQDAAAIAAAAGELQGRYQAWLPLDRESKDADLAAATKHTQQVATSASELSAEAQRFIATTQLAAPSASGQPASSDAATAKSSADANSPSAPSEISQLIVKGEALYSDLTALELSLRQLAARDDGADTAGFAANRLVETRRLISDTSAWVRQLRAHEAGEYLRAAEVDQYRLTLKTEEVANKLGTIEQSLAGLMQRSDGTLPEAIALKAREILATLDKQAAPNQLASIYALRSSQVPRAVERQRAAGDALQRAVKQYDELMRMVIVELDKLPVQDPIASLLDDPTLDEFLTQLEQEFPIEELLGIPQRPSNLQVVDDWLSGRGGGSGGGGRQMMTNQLRQDQQRSQRRLDQAYRRAIARALKEVKPKRTVVIPKATNLSDWNRLVSKLEDDLQQSREKAPPEQYRRAIEQYFSQISGVVTERDKQNTQQDSP